MCAFADRAAIGSHIRWMRESGEGGRATARTDSFFNLFLFIAESSLQKPKQHLQEQHRRHQGGCSWLTRRGTSRTTAAWALYKCKPRTRTNGSSPGRGSSPVAWTTRVPKTTARSAPDQSEPDALDNIYIVLRIYKRL